jgi:hypothetical protein
MRRLCPLLIIISLVITACSGATPTAPEVELPVASSTATATPSLFQSLADLDTPTPPSVIELNLSFTLTPNDPLTATPTLTPTLTASSIFAITVLSTPPPLLATTAPQKSPFLKRDKNGGEPCG